ncbi:hypothetical protein VSR82_34720 [Burkholderia sp. JPY481]|uniref:hypothetical protein n=1 Tax=Paraburkholderia sp. BR14264 TaxID=3237001 RepID=UPI00317875BE
MALELVAPTRVAHALSLAAAAADDNAESSAHVAKWRILTFLCLAESFLITCFANSAPALREKGYRHREGRAGSRNAT